MNKIKSCTICHKNKDLWEFSFRHKKKVKRRSECKACESRMKHRHYIGNKKAYLDRNRNRRAKNRTMLNELKNNPCMDCGQSFHYCQMHYDHREAKYKIGNISWLVNSHYLKVALKEIEKCDLVCANCHALRTWTRSQNKMH